jgi:allophanate hydrolase subunit 2
LLKGFSNYINERIPPWDSIIKNGDIVKLRIARIGVHCYFAAGGIVQLKRCLKKIPIKCTMLPLFP